MTHKDIFTKFMIEYDKANVTSSYPSLTEYEIATFLDKAYFALIDQKFTGNNVRRAPFEIDSKLISDLQPLITHQLLFIGNAGRTTKSKLPFGKSENNAFGTIRRMPDNVRNATLPSDMMYFVAAAIPVDMHKVVDPYEEKYRYQESNGKLVNILQPMDNKDEDYKKGEYKSVRMADVQLVDHHTAERFFATSYNLPWVKKPVCYIEDNELFVVTDPIYGVPELYYTTNESSTPIIGEYVSVTYLKKPNVFAKDLEKIQTDYNINLNSTIDDAEGTYQSVTPNFSFCIDRYNIDGSYDIDGNPGTIYTDSRLHINEIKMYLSESNPKANTFFVEINESDAELLKNVSISDINNGNVILGSTVKRSSSDDSLSLKPGQSLAVCYKNQTDQQFGGWIVLSWNTLFNLFVTRLGEIGISLPQWFPSLNQRTNIITVYTNFDNAMSFSTERHSYQASSPYSRLHSMYLDSSIINTRIYPKGAVAENNVELSYSTYTGKQTDVINMYRFELSDSMAEQLISLAITYALENVESPRLSPHTQLRGLES